jgi:cell division transport system permease protein
MRALRYACGEAISSLWRGRRAGLLSIGTIAVAFFVLGGLLMLTGNLERLGDEWSRSAEMSVYVQDPLTEAERVAIERQLAPGALIAGYQFVSKDEALARFKRTFADLADTVDTLHGNPLPASFEARLTPESRTGPALNDLVSRLLATDGVSDVRYDQQWLDRLLGGVRLVRTAGLILSGVLVIAAALTVANVVRLSLVARREEIDIMHLVGAPPAYVRGPFVMEGVFQGGLGALLAIAALGLVFLAVRGPYLTPLAATLNISAVGFLELPACLVLLAGGMAVGCLGGLLASGRS